MFEFPHHLRVESARRPIVRLALATVTLFLTTTPLAAQARHESANFLVSAATPQVARRIAEVAEACRARFGREWLNSELPSWDSPCHITVEERPSGGEGWISYEMFRGKADRIQITLKGRLERIIEYVLPHEVAHATLAVVVGRSLPRWIDEGVALMCESESQQARQRKTMEDLTARGDVQPLRSIFKVVDYPEDHRQLVGFYASCFSLTEYLVNQGGRQRFLAFVKEGARSGWEPALVRHYGWDMEELESDWRAAILSRGGRDPIDVAATSLRTP